MPSYVYKCDKGHVTEKFEPMSAPAEQLCPACAIVECDDPQGCACEHGIMVRQIGAGAGFMFKGGAPTRKFHRRG